MKATLKYWILFAGLFLTTLPLMAEDYWQRAVVNYTRQQYHSGNQNWQIAQSREGWMYFANNKGLLEFDGLCGCIGTIRAFRVQREGAHGV